MHWLTEKADLRCSHDLGSVGIAPSQTLVAVMGEKVLVDDDPERKAISGCPNVGPGIKACCLTLKVKKGYSDLLRIQGRRVCLSTVTGLTDGTPPGIVTYTVRNPGQNLVGES